MQVRVVGLASLSAGAAGFGSMGVAQKVEHPKLFFFPIGFPSTTPEGGKTDWL